MNGFVLILVGALAGSQIPGAETATFRGSVRDGESGEPIGRAVVELFQDPEALPAVASRGRVISPNAAVTGAAGSFVMTNVEPGEYRLRVSRNGFVAFESGDGSDPAGDDGIVLAADQDVGVEIALRPASTISGRVYGQRGQLLPRVQVDAFRYEPEGEPSGVPLATAMTDDRGEYRLFWLGPGEYVIRASIPNTPAAHGIENMTPSFGSETLFYPRAHVGADATPVAIEQGEDVSGIEFTMSTAFAPAPKLADIDADSAPRIEGVVTRAGTGEPLAGVLIELTPADALAGARSRTGVAEIATVTDSDGRFLLAALEGGAYRLAALLDGFVRNEYGQPRLDAEGSRVDVSAESRLDVRVEMTPAGTAAGRVFDSRGEPLPAIAVQAYQPRYGPDGVRRLELIQTTVTGDRGEYRLFWLTPGDYLIVANRAGPWAGAGLIRAANTEPHRMFAPTFYPGTPIEAEAAVVAVLPGDIGGRMDFEVTPAEAVPMAGRVVTSIPGARLAGLMSISRSEDGVPEATRMIRRDAEGRFALPDALPGRYRVLTALSGVDGSISRQFTVEVPRGGVDDLELRIDPGARVEARLFVEDPSGRIARISEERLFGTVRLVLHDENDASHVANAYDAPSDIVFADMAPGSYRLEVSNLDRDLYLKSVRSNREDSPGDTVEVLAGGSTLDLLLSARGGQITGVVRDSDGLESRGVHVVLVPDADRRGTARFYRTAVSGDDGRFDLNAIAPGGYRLFAWDQLDGFEYYDPAFLGRFEHRGLPLRIEEDELRSVDLDILFAP